MNKPIVNWHLEIVPIKQLKENPKNPRQITKDQIHHLQNLIEKFGLIDKPVVNMDHTIIGGHQRIRVLKRMKEKSVECWVADKQLSEEDIEHLMVGLNLNQGNWDWDILANEFEPLKLLEMGFTEQQLLGKFQDDEEDENLEEKPNKKLKKCPGCGHEF